MAVQFHLNSMSLKHSLKIIALLSGLILALPSVCGAQSLDINVFNTALSAPDNAATAPGETYRDCDVCPNKVGLAVAAELPQLAKRCDTCTDSDVMGVEIDAVQIKPDFSGYTDPAEDSPESLKPF